VISQIETMYPRTLPFDADVLHLIWEAATVCDFFVLESKVG